MITVTHVDQTPPPFAYKEPYYISVMLGKRASFVEKPFRCFNCGAILFKYYTDVHIVFDGLTLLVYHTITNSFGFHTY